MPGSLPALLGRPVPFLRYEFPRVQSRFGRAAAEHHARELPRRWLAVPLDDRFPARLEGEAQRYGAENDVGYCDADTPLEGSEQLARWLRRGAYSSKWISTGWGNRMPVYTATRDFEAPGSGVLGRSAQIRKGQQFKVVGQNSNGVLLVQNEQLSPHAAIQITPDGVISGGWVQANGAGIPAGSGWPTDPVFQRSEAIADENGAFRAEIIYSGIAGNTMRAVYREYVNDLARPAFTQELQYDLSQSKSFNYKSVSVDVLNATNSYVEYRVTDDAGLPWLPR